MQSNHAKLLYLSVIAVVITGFIMLAGLWFFSYSANKSTSEQEIAPAMTAQDMLEELTRGLPKNDSPVIIRPGEENQPLQFSEAYAALNELSNVGDHKATAEAFETIVDYGQNNDERAVALIKAGTFNALSQDLEDVRKGVEQLGQVAQFSASPARQAEAFLNAAQITCGTGCNEDYFKIVFSVEPFDAYKVGDDMGRSVARLFERSLALDPRASSYVRLMSWYGEQLITDDQLTEAQKESYKDKVVRYDEEAKKLYSDEITRTRPKVSFHFWRGYAYGGLVAAGYNEYIQEFVDSYEYSMNLAQGSQPGDSISEVATFAYYQYAALLYHIYGTERDAEIKTLLASLANMVDSDSDAANNQFIGMVRTEIASNGGHGFIGESIFTLAAAYPDFAAFINRHLPGALTVE